MADKDLIDHLKKEDIYPFLESYYQSIGRNNPPNYQSYSLLELKKCLRLFHIHLTRENCLTSNSTSEDKII